MCEFTDSIVFLASVPCFMGYVLHPYPSSYAPDHNQISVITRFKLTVNYNYRYNYSFSLLLSKNALSHSFLDLFISSFIHFHLLNSPPSHSFTYHSFTYCQAPLLNHDIIHCLAQLYVQFISFSC